MCDNHDDDDLNDGIDDLWSDFGREPIAPRPLPVPQPATPFVETCSKCRGTGRFVSYSGRLLGECFACKGKGKKTFKTAPEQRAKGRESAEAARRRKLDELRAARDAWMRENAVEWRWMVDRAPRFDFAQAMVEAVDKYGYLTERQLDAVRRCVMRDEERNQQRNAEREAKAKVVDVTAIHEAFATAVGNGVRTPKLRLDTFTFSLAPVHGANAGAIYVKEGKGFDAPYLGKVLGGKFYRSRDCSDDQEQRVVAAAGDPGAAAVAYGRRYGACSICGRELTNHASIDLGIGPICAERYGF